MKTIIWVGEKMRFSCTVEKEDMGANVNAVCN